MARKKNGTDAGELSEDADVSQEIDVDKLSKALVKAFNRDEAKTGTIAWNLATDTSTTSVTEWISTNNTLLDYCISNRRNGGVPVGKIIEILGEEASGKTLMCIHIAANTQKMGGVVAYLDAEHAFHPEFATQIGLDLAKMIYLQPGTVEEAGEMIEKMILMTRQKAPNQLVTVIWDSTAQTPTRAEIEGEYDINMNVQMEKPKALAKMMRKLTQVIGKERICLVFTNQLKFRPGVTYGDPMFAPGGKAVPYAASVRIRLTRGKAQKEGGDADTGEDGDGDIMGVHTSAKVIKNRLGPPLRKCRFFISFEHGVEDEQSWFNFLHDRDVIEKPGNGYVKIPEFQSVLRDHWLRQAQETVTLLEKEQDPEQQRALKKMAKGFEEFATKCVPDGKDNKYGWQFRESAWLDVLRDTPGLRKWVEDKLEQLLVVRYGEKPDPESLMEVEQTVADALGEGEAA